MIQIYFLSICLNIIAGMVLSASHFSERFPVTASVRAFIFEQPKLKAAMIAALFLIGLMKIISVSKGDVPVVGDLLPALALLLSGLTLTVEYLLEKNRSEETSGDVNENNLLGKLESIFVEHQEIVGVASLVTAVLHFIFPKVLFL